MDKYIASQGIDINALAALAELEMQAKMKPTTGEMLIGQAGGVARSYIDNRAKTKAAEQALSREEQQRQEDMNYGLTRQALAQEQTFQPPIPGYEQPAPGQTGSPAGPYQRPTLQEEFKQFHPEYWKGTEKQPKQYAPQRGPVVGSAGQYYQTYFSQDETGAMKKQAIPLEAEPIQVTAQRQALMEKYTDNEKTAADTKYRQITTFAAVQANQHQDNPAKYTEVFNQAMNQAIGKEKNPRIKQALKELWTLALTPIETQGSGATAEDPK